MLSRIFLLLATLALAGCLSDSSGDGKTPVVGSLPLTSAVPQTPIAPHLSRCLYSGSEEEVAECTLEHVPLVGMRGATVSVETVMEHLLVEREWMASRFRQVLEALPPDLLGLFRSTTGVVIASDIRPSFYWSYTGAIYIDPAYLWITEDEFRQTPQFPDHRSNYGDELKFLTLSRYVKDGEYAYNTFRTYAPGRTLDDVVLATSRLLTHELAHAADYISPAAAMSAYPAQTVFDLVIGLNPERVAYELSTSFPLYSDTLHGLADVRFHGVKASEHQKALTPDDVAAEFYLDGAGDHYNYASQAEDVAMLFEEVVMHHYFDLQRDFAIVDNPAGDNLTAADYTVYWGQRGRVGAPEVRERAVFVAGHVLPELDREAVAASLSQPAALPRHSSWWDSLGMTEGKPGDTAAKPGHERQPPRDIQDDKLPAGL